MIPHKCLVNDPERGDCMRACIATIINAPDPAKMPNFIEEINHPEEFGPAIKEYLKTMGLTLFQGELAAASTIEALEHWDAYAPDVPAILMGTSRKGFNHAVVIDKGLIFNDPSDAGIVGPLPSGNYHVVVICVGPNFGHAVPR